MSSKREQAEVMLRQQVPAVEIAEQLGVSAATVRTWKSRMKKAEETGRNVSLETKRNVAKKTLRKMSDKADENAELTEQQKRFCLLYAQRPNATRAYRLAFEGCAYTTANTEGPALLVNPCIREEVKRQKEIVMESLMADPADLFRLYWDIAFADLGDFARWGQEEVPVMGPFGPVVVDQEDENGEVQKVPLTKVVNSVRFQSSDQVDSALVSEVKVGRDGASVKMRDQMAAMRWLSDYFLMHPMDQHKKEYDARRLALEEAKSGEGQQQEGDIIFHIVPAEQVPDEIEEDEEKE